MTVAVMGCLNELPRDFPLEMPENSGNMVHANAPFEMFPGAVHARDPAWRRSGAASFAQFVNEHCTHLVLTMANTLRLNSDDDEKYARLLRFVEHTDKPVVTFGLGVQGMTDDLSSATLPPSAVRLMQVLGQRSATVGVRGDLTKQVLERVCGVSNVTVTGCPSLFSRPEALRQLSRNTQRLDGRAAYAGTRHHEPAERALLHQAVRDDLFLVEPVNKRLHTYVVKVGRGEVQAPPPPFLKENGQAVHPTHGGSLAHWVQGRYRLFRRLDDWYAFNRESVAFTFGSRFHVNMASVLSGRPALWVTHDARTRELCRFLHLPAVSLGETDGMTWRHVRERLDYGEFFTALPGLFDNFQTYLRANGLPAAPGWLAR